jgi:NADH-quinone oxidoreductase subunit A
MDLYTPVLALAGLATAFAVFSVAASALVGPRRYNRAKVSSYECGVEASPHAQRGERIPVKYYTVAMTFIIFDVEIMFMIPWAVHFDELGVFGMFAMFLFLLNISIAYLYEWRRGGLDWD